MAYQTNNRPKSGSWSATAFLMRASAIATVVVLSGLLLSTEAHAQQRPPSPIEVAPVISRKINSSQTYVGSVTPLKASAVGSAVNGRVDEFPIEEGDFVKARAPLAQLLIETIKLEHAAAEQELELRKQELLELQNGSRPEEKRRSQAALEAAKANKQYHDQLRTRALDLQKRNAINEDEFQLIVSNQIQATQQYEQAREEYDLIMQGPRAEKIAQAKAQVAIQEAITQKLADQKAKHTIRAPFDGYVSAEHTEVGQWVQQGDLIAEVIALNKVEVKSLFPSNTSLSFVRMTPSLSRSRDLRSALHRKDFQDHSTGRYEVSNFSDQDRC